MRNAIILLTAIGLLNGCMLGLRQLVPVQPERPKQIQRQTSSVNRVQLVPQEKYGETLLQLLGKVDSSTKKIRILQFNFFTDNPSLNYPKQVAAKLIEIHTRFPLVDIAVLLESKKDLEK